MSLEETKNRFNYIARQLADIGLYADIDAESLGRYIIAEETLQKIRKRLKKEMPFEQYEKNAEFAGKIPQNLPAICGRLRHDRIEQVQAYYSAKAERAGEQIRPFRRG